MSTKPEGRGKVSLTKRQAIMELLAKVDGSEFYELCRTFRNAKGFTPGCEADFALSSLQGWVRDLAFEAYSLGVEEE